MSKRQLRQTVPRTETGRAVHTTVLYFEYQEDGLHFTRAVETGDD